MRLNDIFPEVLAESERAKRLEQLKLSLEHHTYKEIPGSTNSYRLDPPRTSAMTQRHAHVYAKRGGSGKELYSVNIDGTGHDGSSGTLIPAKHADFFRTQGFNISMTNSLESIDFNSEIDDEYVLLLLEDLNPSTEG